MQVGLVLDEVQHCGDGFLGELLQNIIETNLFIVNVVVAKDRLHLTKPFNRPCGPEGGNFDAY